MKYKMFKYSSNKSKEQLLSEFVEKLLDLETNIATTDYCYSCVKDSQIEDLVNEYFCKGELRKTDEEGGDLMKISTFMKHVDDGEINSDDGSGYWVNEKMDIIGDYRFWDYFWHEIEEAKPDNAKYVIWYNK